MQGCKKNRAEDICSLSTYCLGWHISYLRARQGMQHFNQSLCMGNCAYLELTISRSATLILYPPGSCTLSCREVIAIGRRRLTCDAAQDCQGQKNLDAQQVDPADDLHHKPGFVCFHLQGPLSHQPIHDHVQNVWPHSRHRQAHSHQDPHSCPALSRLFHNSLQIHHQHVKHMEMICMSPRPAPATQ